MDRDFIRANNIQRECQSIIDSAVDMMFHFIVMDKYENLVYINEKYCNYLGIKYKDVVGKPVKNIIPNTRLTETIISGKPTYEEIFTYTDGRQLIHTKFPIKDDSDETIGVISVTSFDTLSKIKELYERINQLEETQSLLQDQVRYIGRPTTHPKAFDSIQGVSPQIRAIKRELSRVVNNRMPILLIGESGTGKEVFASAIHKAGARADAPYVKVNCAAIPKELLESELFGYEAGSFSGALRTGKAGKFELANNGTILLDEIEELPLDMQAKLLRVLQEYEVERIGSIKPIKLNIQLICCTNVDLKKLAEEKKFREDLLYRINVLEIKIPPLRERREDIPSLCKYFIKKINVRYNFNITFVTDEAVKFLSEQEWRGNVRELEHALERASAMVQTGPLTLQDFDFISMDKHTDTPSANVAPAESGLYKKKDELERAEIKAVIESCGGNKSKAAEELGISRGTLYAKLDKYKIEC